jgi:hypothetical protein
VPALQAPRPEFMPWYHQNNNNNKFHTLKGVD